MGLGSPAAVVRSCRREDLVKTRGRHLYERMGRSLAPSAPNTLWIIKPYGLHPVFSFLHSPYLGETSHPLFHSSLPSISSYAFPTASTGHVGYRLWTCCSGRVLHYVALHDSSPSALHLMRYRFESDPSCWESGTTIIISRRIRCLTFAASPPGALNLTLARPIEMR